jgi:hypothetical protein
MQANDDIMQAHNDIIQTHGDVMQTHERLIQKIKAVLRCVSVATAWLFKKKKMLNVALPKTRAFAWTLRLLDYKREREIPVRRKILQEKYGILHFTPKIAKRIKSTK